MEFKKIISMLFIMIMFGFVFAGCGNTDDGINENAPIIEDLNNPNDSNSGNDFEEIVEEDVSLEDDEVEIGSLI